MSKIDFAGTGGGGGGTPGAPQFSIQFNNPLGNFSGDAGFLYDATRVVQGDDSTTKMNGINLYLLKSPDAATDQNNLCAINMVVHEDVIQGFGGTGQSIFSTQSQFYSWNGDLSYNSTTQAKTNVIGNYMLHVAKAGGQSFVENRWMYGLGMGDKYLTSDFIQHSGGPVDGDEGVGFNSVSYVTQSPQLFQQTVTSVTRSSANTTTTQIITGDGTMLQAVTVASTAGISVGDWVVVEQQTPRSDANIEAVKVTAVNPGVSITGQFRNNHASGVTITAALVLGVDGQYGFGQYRVLVNLSGASYSTGTVSSISGGGFIGSGTTWTNAMVGGNALCIGAVALTNDDYTGSPFGAGAAAQKSWYQILSFTDATHIGIYTTSAAGDHAYHGKGVGAGAYIIRPAVRILAFDPADTTHLTLVCETTPATWSVGHTVECTTSPYPDVTPFAFHLQDFTAGGVRRQFMDVVNTGARTYQTGFQVESNMQVGGNSDSPIAFDRGFRALTGHNVGFEAQASAQVGFYANNNPAVGFQVDGSSSKNIWSKSGSSINTFEGEIDVGVSAGNTGKVKFIGTAGGIVTLSTQDAAGTYILKLPNVVGTNGQVLQTDGGTGTAGVALTSWVTAGSSGITVNTTTITGGTTKHVAYDNAGTFGEAASFTIESGQPNVPIGKAYLYNTTAKALYGVPNGSGDNFFEGDAGNFTLTGYSNFGTGPDRVGGRNIRQYQCCFGPWCDVRPDNRI